MKVVLFCGGLGMRLREYSDSIPKPMVKLGYRPILWNIMKYYAYFGHKDFILCLGYKADIVKDYFLHYDECISNDFIYEGGGKNLHLLNSDIEDWKITFVDTGINSNIGTRLMMAQEYVQDDEMFLANYSDGLTDMNLNLMIHEFSHSSNIAGFMAYQPNQSFHVVSVFDNGQVKNISHINESGLWINTGFFVFRKNIFDFMEYGEELVEQPFHRLIDSNRLFAYRHSGFWASMDTFKDKQTLDDLYARGTPPWELWNLHKKHNIENAHAKVK